MDNKKYFEKHTLLGLLALVALPVPGAGTWTGAVVADFLGMPKKESFFLIALGVTIGAIAVFLGGELFAREAWAFNYVR